MTQSKEYILAPNNFTSRITVQNCLDHTGCGLNLEENIFNKIRIRRRDSIPKHITSTSAFHTVEEPNISTPAKYGWREARGCTGRALENASTIAEAGYTRTD